MATRGVEHTSAGSGAHVECDDTKHVVTGSTEGTLAGDAGHVGAAHV